MRSVIRKKVRMLLAVRAEVVKQIALATLPEPRKTRQGSREGSLQ